jgi:hypothetical protein
MVSILPSQRSPWDVIGSSIGQNLQKTLPGAVQQGYNRGQLKNSLGELAELAKSGASPLDVTLAAMQAGAGIPGSERYMGQIIPMLQQLASANASQKAPVAGEQVNQEMQSRDRSAVEPMAQKQQLPQFVDALKKQTEQSFPTNIGPEGGPGQVPQPATTGQKLPILTPQQLIPQAKELSKERTANGIPTTVKEALEELKGVEQDKKLYNAEVDRELSQRVKGQKSYGDKAVEYLKEVDPKATSEIQTIFQKKGEELSKLGESEADINRALVKEAERYKNAIANVKSDLDAPRTYNLPQRLLNGTYKSFDESAEDARKHLQPLIDLGLYNKARSILQDKDYGPEEREMVIHPLSDQSVSLIRQLPDLNPTQRVGKRGISAPKPDINSIKDTLKKIKEVDPNFSPLLARRAFEDLNYDWRSFKNAWNELLNEGFELTGDQKDMQGYLDTPPVGFLDKFLSGLNLTGR